MAKIVVVYIRSHMQGKVSLYVVYLYFLYRIQYNYKYIM